MLFQIKNPAAREFKIEADEEVSSVKIKAVDAAGKSNVLLEIHCDGTTYAWRLDDEFAEVFGRYITPKRYL